MTSLTLTKYQRPFAMTLLGRVAQTSMLSWTMTRPMWPFGLAAVLRKSLKTTTILLLPKENSA